MTDVHHRNIDVLKHLDPDQLIDAFDYVDEAIRDRIPGNTHVGVFDSIPKGIALGRENLNAAIKDRPIDRDNLIGVDESDVRPPDNPFLGPTGDGREFVRGQESVQDVLDEQERRNPWRPDPPDRGPKFDDTTTGKTGEAVDRIMESPAGRAAELAEKALQADRWLEARNNNDPVDVADMGYANKLNDQLSDIQREAGIASTDHFQVEPSFFTTTHHEATNVLLNITEQAAEAGADDDVMARMEEGLQGVRQLQVQDGRYPDTAIDNVLDGAQGDSAGERLAWVRDVGLSSGVYNPFAVHNGGHLTYDAAGVPQRDLEIAYARSFATTPMGRAVEAGAVGPDGTLRMKLGEAVAQLDRDVAAARLEDDYPHETIERLLSKPGLVEDARTVAEDMADSAGFTLDVPYHDDLGPDGRATHIVVGMAQKADAMCERGQDVDPSPLFDRVAEVTGYPDYCDQVAERRAAEQQTLQDRQPELEDEHSYAMDGG